VTVGGGLAGRPPVPLDGRDVLGDDVDVEGGEDDEPPTLNVGTCTFTDGSSGGGGACGGCGIHALRRLGGGGGSAFRGAGA